MCRKYSLASLAIFLVLGVMFSGCVPKKTPEKPAPKSDSQAVVETLPEGYHNISAAQLKAKIDGGENFILLDVREPSEYKMGHIKGAKLLPVGEIEERWHELDPAREVVVYCRSGHRSTIAAEKLVKLGFNKVKNLLGGILDWPYGIIK
ncbi:MAG: rhodanese-like domain-containing protein [bacterium]